MKLNVYNNGSNPILYIIGLYSILSLSYKYYLYHKEANNKLKDTINCHTEEIKTIGKITQQFYSTVIKIKRDQNTILKNLNYNFRGCDEADDVDDYGFKKHYSITDTKIHSDIRDIVNNMIDDICDDHKDEPVVKNNESSITDEQIYEYISNLDTINIVDGQNKHIDKNKMYNFISYIFKIT